MKNDDYRRPHACIKERSIRTWFSGCAADAGESDGGWWAFHSLDPIPARSLQTLLGFLNIGGGIELFIDIAATIYSIVTSGRYKPLVFNELWKLYNINLFSCELFSLTLIVEKPHEWRRVASAT